MPGSSQPPTTAQKRKVRHLRRAMRFDPQDVAGVGVLFRSWKAERPRPRSSWLLLWNQIATALCPPLSIRLTRVAPASNGPKAILG